MNEMHSLNLIFVVNLVILLSQIDGKRACIEEERMGLLELKSFLKLKVLPNGSECVVLPSWVDDPTSDCCGWDRVTCNSTTGRIHKLNLFNVVGKYDLEFKQCDDEDHSPLWNISLFQSFKELKTLNMSYNCITGIEKQGLFRLQKLETLDLSYNSFNSSDDLQTMRKLKSLKKLILRDCTTGGFFPARVLVNLLTFGKLEELDLRSNFLEGSIPQNLGQLSSLEELYLADNFFNGSLPVPGLCELRRLQVLDISYNSFGGTLPSCLSNLTTLKILDLSHNLFSGLISPNVVPSPKFLQVLDISSNNFVGSFSFSYLFNHSKLEVVILGGPENKLQIDNDNKVEMTPLFQLKALLLFNCSMKNAPLFLLNQYRLRWVDMSYNKFNGAWPSWLLQNNTDLLSLSIGNNFFTGKLDGHLPQHSVSGMVRMDVSHNQMDGHVPKDLGIILQNLKYLDLSCNLFEGELPPSVGSLRRLVPQQLVKNCTDLEGLLLNDNHFHGEFFSAHFNWSRTRFLILRNNGFTGSLTTNKEFYGWMECFDVSNNNMTGKIPDGIDSTVLLLHNNSFEGRIPCEGWIRAEVIDISHNFLSEPIPSCLSSKVYVRSFQFVSTLNLRDNRLSGKLPVQIGDLQYLRILLLGNNRFSGLIPRQLCQLRRISIMDISNNSFSGSIPSCFSNVSFGNDEYDHVWADASFTSRGHSFVHTFEGLYDEGNFNHAGVLEFKFNIDFVTKNSLLSYKGDILRYMSGLDLSSNNLTGVIPPSLGKLSSIHALNLSHDHLTGHIPVSFSNLSQIESLDFSHNSLSGKIPSELVRLNFLEVFSVAHNNLSGRVPDKGQFPTFGISSYEGNPFLTGLPSEKNRTKVVDTPIFQSDDETEGKWYGIDRTSFFASFTATFCVILLSFGAVLYINPYWRRRWFYLIENFIYSSYYFVVDTLGKLATIFNN